MIITKRYALILVSASLLTVGTAAAQQPVQAPTAPASVEGIAVDSLHRGFLRGAMLTVEGSSISASSLSGLICRRAAWPFLMCSC